jgi:hypothetical protein
MLLMDNIVVILKYLPQWDKRVMNVQVTNFTERFKEISILVTSEDASKNRDLKVAVREKLIDFINEKYPGSFARIRLQQLQ